MMAKIRILNIGLVLFIYFSSHTYKLNAQNGVITDSTQSVECINYIRAFKPNINVKIDTNLIVNTKLDYELVIKIIKNYRREIRKESGVKISKSNAHSIMRCGEFLLISQTLSKRNKRTKYFIIFDIEMNTFTYSKYIKY